MLETTFVARVHPGDDVAACIALKSKGTFAVLLGMGVHPEYQGKGLEHPLMKHALDYLDVRGYSATFAVGPSERLVPILSRCGFKEPAPRAFPRAAREKLGASAGKLFMRARQVVHCDAVRVGEALLRPARMQDVGEMRRIFNDCVEEEGCALLDTESLSMDDMANVVQGHGPRHPILVAEEGSQLVGWACLEPYGGLPQRPCYERCASAQVLLQRDARGRGLAEGLLGALLRSAKANGFHKLCVAIRKDNDSALRLFTRLHFHFAGEHRDQIRVNGRWVDTVCMDLVVDDDEAKVTLSDTGL